MFRISNHKYFWLVLKIIISGLLLTYILATVSFNNILYSIKSADMVFVIIALLLTFPINYLSAFQTHYLTRIQGMTITVITIIKIHLITTYYSLFLPGILSAGAVKWYKFSKYGTRSSAAAVVVLNRFIETFVIVILGILFFILELNQSSSQESFIFLAALLLLLITSYLLLFKERTNKLIISLVYKFPLPKLVKNKIHSFLMAMNQFRILTIRDHFEINGIIIFYNLIGLLSFYFFAKAMTINLDIFTLGWIRSALGLLSLLPVSFAGFGVREGSLIVMLSQYGVASHTAMAFSFLLFIRNLLNAGVGGILDMIPQRNKINHNFAVESADDH